MSLYSLVQYTKEVIASLWNTPDYNKTQLLYLIDHAKKAVRHAFANQSKLSPTILNLDGMSGYKTRHLYNNMCNLAYGVYCEVGTWKGSSFIAAMYNNPGMRGICIDNWSEFGGPKQECIKSIHEHLPRDGFVIHDKDCWDITEDDIGGYIDIYLYDGEHSYESQKRAITHYYKFFNKYVIILVDDWTADWVQVKKGTMDGIQEAGLIVHWSQEIGLVNTDQHHQGGNTFWNGCGVFVCERTDI